MAAVIQQDHAIDIAQGIKAKAAAEYQRGTLDRFARGQYQGMFLMVSGYMGLPHDIAQSIENELDNLCSLARKAGQ